MTPRTRTYLAAALLIAFIAIATAAWSHLKLTKLEKAARIAVAESETQRARAERLETETHIYKEKAAYLERQIAEQNTAARRQDEELKKLSANTDSARRGLRDARRRTN